MAKKNKVPKTVLGAHIPKFVRQSNITQTLLGNALVRQILANALIAAAGAAALALTRTTAGKKAGKAAVDGGAFAKGALKNAVAAASGSIRNVTKDLVGINPTQRREIKRKEKALRHAH